MLDLEVLSIDQSVWLPPPWTARCWISDAAWSIRSCSWCRKFRSRNFFPGHFPRRSTWTASSAIRRGSFRHLSWVQSLLLLHLFWSWTFCLALEAKLVLNSVSEYIQTTAACAVSSSTAIVSSRIASSLLMDSSAHQWTERIACLCSWLTAVAMALPAIAWRNRWLAWSRTPTHHWIAVVTWSQTASACLLILP